jgi:hypothetical protein
MRTPSSFVSALGAASVLAALSLAPCLAAAQPGAVVAPPGPPVTVDVRAEGREGLTLHQVIVEGPRSHWTGRRYDATRPLCTAPCRLQLPAGAYRFAISEGGDPTRSDQLTDLRGPTQLSLDYQNRAGLRTAGWVTFGVGAVLGAGLAVPGALLLVEQETLAYGLLFAGLGTIALAGIVSIPFVAFEDHVRITPTSISGQF